MPASESNSTSQRFLWPPRRPDDGGALDQSARSEQGDTPRLAVYLWRTIENTWLDVVTPPMSERLAAAAFTPDPLWAYCPRCGLSVGPYDVTVNDGVSSCSACRTDSRTAEELRICRTGGWDRVVRLGEYRHPLRGMIHDVKFTAWRRLGTDLGRMLGESIKAAIEDAREDGVGLPQGRPIVVPIPASTWRRMSRGIDHAHVIARGVCQTLDADFEPLLWRRHRPTQAGLAASRRQTNVAGSIKPRRTPWYAKVLPQARGLPQNLHEPRLVIVVDDIMTTGATLKAASRAIQEYKQRSIVNGASAVIWAAVLARTALRRAGNEGL